MGEAAKDGRYEIVMVSKYCILGYEIYDSCVPNFRGKYLCDNRCLIGL